MDSSEKRNEVPSVEIEVKEEEIEKGALEILKIIRPNWEESSITFKLLTDGITNKLMACKPEEEADEETVLVRIYGNKTDLIIDRKAETRNILLLNRAGLAPDLYATFRNGLAYKFLPGKTLTSDTVRNPVIYELVARQMARLHKVQPDDGRNGSPFIWDKIRRFLDLIPDVFSDSDKQRRFSGSGFAKGIIEEELRRVKSAVETSRVPIVFAHNDLLLGNVIYNEQLCNVTFIDYEYAALNYQPFDIANHFAEFVGLAEPLDYDSLYPDKEFQQNWIRIYLEEFTGVPPSQKDVESLYVHVNKFVLLSHLFWGVWALVQAEYSYINFDYMGYAFVRFTEYFKRKESFLNLNLPS
ncbi:unnamed protein product [Phyllotreta striolata]|uniref:ethanolamine kinase n=1 Tax=Phyllotreta striolata TaxID=444603 RepID=A0A9N9XP43_PHYSR|nr:unnamed protein product [Phyllotreta striolata]